MGGGTGQRLVSRFWQSLLAPVSESTHTHVEMYQISTILSWSELWPLLQLLIKLRPVDEQSQRELSLGSTVTPAKRQNMKQMSNSPKCVSWASPSEVSSKKIRNDTQELIRSENMDRRRALVPSH